MPRNWYLDDELNRNWLKVVAVLRARLGLKAGRFVTIEGRPVFIGGPRQGGGVSSPPPAGPTLDQRISQAARFGDDNFANDWANERWTEWHNELSTEQEEAIEVYSGNAYPEINALMREGSIPESGYQIENAAYEHFRDSGDVSAADWDEWKNEYVDEYSDILITNLTEGIAMGKAPQDVMVFRGTDAALFDGLKAGDQWGDNGYVSTSLSAEQSSEFGDFQLQILVGKGSTAAFLNGISQNESELEVLLPSGSKFNIVSRTADGAVLELQ